MLPWTWAHRCLKAPFISFAYLPSIGMAGPSPNSVLIFLRNRRIGFGSRPPCWGSLYQWVSCLDRASWGLLYMKGGDHMLCSASPWAVPAQPGRWPWSHCGATWPINHIGIFPRGSRTASVPDERVWVSVCILRIPCRMLSDGQGWDAEPGLLPSTQQVGVAGAHEAPRSKM